MSSCESLQPEPILQDRLPVLPWRHPATARLPGVQPLAPTDWITVDEAYPQQMALRDRLLSAKRAEVLALDPEGEAAAGELLRQAVDALGAMAGFSRTAGSVRCPDGREVALDVTRPFEMLGRLVQEDFCLLVRDGDLHRLVGAVLCFPAGWRLADKMGRPLLAIHDPVPVYDDDLGRRVERLFAMVRVGQPLWRANALLYDDPSLFQPWKREAAAPSFVRSEVQTITRLPDSGAIVFGIHTYVVPLERISPADRAGLEGLAA